MCRQAKDASDRCIDYDAVKHRGVAKGRRLSANDSSQTNL